MKYRTGPKAGGGVGRRSWLGLAALALLVACGGGGSATGEPAFGDGSGDPSFGGGGGTPPFGSGAGDPPFGPGAGGGGGQSGDGPRPNPDAAVVVSNADIQGAVVDATSGAALSGATVRFAGVTLTTNTDGRYEEDPASTTGRVVFEGLAPNYEVLYSPAEVLGTVPSVSLLRLTPYGATADITVATGGTVTESASTAAVTVPANALTAIGGGSVPATVGVRITAIAAGVNPRVLSGDYTDGSGNVLQTYGGVNLNASAAVEVSPGQTLSLRIPVNSRTAAVPSSASLYLFDPVAGVWALNGPVSLVGGAFVAEVDRFGQWMVGEPLGAAAPSVIGCVQDDTGAPAANVRMEIEGVTYSGTAQVTTDSGGNFSLPARASSRIVVSGRRGAFITNAVARDIATADVTITPCLTIPSSNGATMRLTWGANPRDIDSHLRTPDGAHVYFVSQGSLTASPFASLDVDDVDGFGPEVTTIRRPKVGIYRFYLHNYTGSFSPGMTGSPVRLELNYAGRQVVFSPPPGEGSARWWHVFDLYIAPNCTMTLYRYNRWRADEPQNPNASTTFPTATECVP